MNEQRSCLVVVHPGSALGSANMNLGKFEARAARAALAFALEQWEGDVVVIHGEMSDELPYYPRLQEAIQGVLERNRASGHHASEVQETTRRRTIRKRRSMPGWSTKGSSRGQ